MNAEDTRKEESESPFGSTGGRVSLVAVAGPTFAK